MAFNPPVPIKGTVHFDDIKTLWSLKARREDPRDASPDSRNEFLELLEKAATLLELIAILVDFFSGIPPTLDVAPPSVAIGDWNKFAAWAARRAGGAYTPPA